MSVPDTWEEFINGFDKSDLSKTDADAMKELHSSFRYVYVLTDVMALYLWKPISGKTNIFDWLRVNRRYIFVAFLVYWCLVAETIYLGKLFAGKPSAEDVIPLVSYWAFALLAGIKLTVMRGFRDRFKLLIVELEKLWPRDPLSEEEYELKATSLFYLRWFHRFYILTTACAIVGFNSVPIIVGLCHKAFGMEDRKLFPFFLWYPVDKFQPVVYQVLYTFEVITSSHVVATTVGTNLLFSGMANHVCLLMKILQIKLRNSSGPYTDEDISETINSDEALAECVKIHQRLIEFVGDIEKAFTLILLANVTGISINVCCGSFTILIADIFVAVPTFFYIISNLMEMGILCWYGDDVMCESIAIGESIYFSQWYNTNLSARKYQALIMTRSQVPLKFTALKFKDITLESYSSIMCTSYSYFTLLCKMYREE